MKITFISIIVSLAIAVIVGILFFTSYRSAFEADQACHFAKWQIYADKEDYGCDHDIETNQWILFEKSLDKNPAKVLQRFRY